MNPMEYQGTGRRKTSVARVFLRPGPGRILVNKKPLDEYFAEEAQRYLVKQALVHNAAAVIFAHNHPSGVAEPSTADELITQRLKHSLALVDIQVLDHLVVGGGVVESFAERGLL